MPSNETPATAWQTLEQSDLKPIENLSALHALNHLLLHQEQGEALDCDELHHIFEIMHDLLSRLDSGLCQLQEVRVAA